MSDEIITGRIVFSRALLGGEYEDLVDFLTRCAVGNHIWVNVGNEIKDPDARCKYSIGNGESNELSEKDLPFEITDSKDTDECNRITSGISYRDADLGIADWGSSAVPNIERFLVRITEHDLIECVQLAIDLKHGYASSAYADLDIAANEFCKILMSLPNRSALPTGRFNIRKTDKKP